MFAATHRESKPSKDRLWILSLRKVIPPKLQLSWRANVSWVTVTGLVAAALKGVRRYSVKEVMMGSVVVTVDTLSMQIF